MSQYSFVTTWRLPALPETVWATLMRNDEYSSWWKYMESHRLLTPGVTGVGSCSEWTFRGRLPYKLRYRSTITSFDPPREMTYEAKGDLNGHGRLVVQPSPDGKGTVVVWYWDVETRGFWMNLLAPLLKGLFAWNHNQVMKEGERGLIRWLTAHASAPAQAGVQG